LTADIISQQAYVTQYARAKNLKNKTAKYINKYLNTSEQVSVTRGLSSTDGRRRFEMNRTEQRQKTNTHALHQWVSGVTAEPPLSELRAKNGSNGGIPY
jgi:hypothetical protein